MNTSRVGRTAMALLPVTLLARGAGLVVPVLLARWYGVSDDTDAFWFVMGAGAWLVTLGGVGVGTVLVPMFAELDRHRPDRLAPVLGAAVRWTVGFGLAVGLGTRLVLPEVVAAGDPDLHGARGSRVADLALALVPYLTTLGPTAVLRAALEAKGGLGRSAVSPLWRAIATLVVAGALRGEGARWLPLAWLAGGVVEGGWLLLGLQRSGVRVGAALQAPELAAAARAALPVLIGEGLVAANGWVARGAAAFAAPGTTTVLEYADRARLVPQALLEGTLLVAAFTAWSHARASGETAARRAQVVQSLGWVAVGAAPLLGAAWTARRLVAELLYGGGAFEPALVDRVAAAVGAYLPAVYASLLGTLTARALVVEGRTAALLPLGTLSFAAHALAAWALAGWDATGLALASSIASTAACAAGLLTLGPALRAARDLVPAALALAGSVALAALLPTPRRWTDPAVLGLGAWPLAGALALAWLRRRG